MREIPRPVRNFDRSESSLASNLRGLRLIYRSVRRIVIPLFILGLLSVFAAAQSKIQAGIFLDALSISQTGTTNLGLGARFGYRVHPAIMLEGELAYDYGLNFSEAFRNISTGSIAAIERTQIGVTHGMLGPKLQRTHGHLLPFVTAKVGFIDFRLSPSLLPYVDYISPIFNLRTSTLNAAFYPAAGLEAVLGPVGLRLEAGDEMYFNRGTHNNLRITFGPVVRF